MQAKKLSSMPVTHFPDHTRAFLKIQDGCDAYCSYCIVPYARGPERSLPPEAVLDGIKRFARAGYREVVLTGIHLGRYGRDLTPPADLLDLLGQAEREKTVERLRLSSIEALEVTDALIAFMAGSETLCPHLHIPLQSGDDRILALMKRHYETGFFRDLLEKISRAVPDIAIGIDVMVGFPGEDEGAFENTRRFIEALPVAYLHVFPYSERPKTAAAALPGKVPPADRKRRAEALRRLGQAKRAAFAERFIGRELTVLVEGGKNKPSGGITGFSANYIPVVVLPGGANLANQRVRVVPEHYEDGKLFARMIDLE
jgi:threonylcarbamoyladenosine tRNA methylthiotransferase MtaB